MAKLFFISRLYFTLKNNSFFLLKIIDTKNPFSGNTWRKTRLRVESYERMGSSKQGGPRGVGGVENSTQAVDERRSSDQVLNVILRRKQILKMKVLNVSCQILCTRY